MKYSMMTYTMMRQGCFTPEDCIRVASELKMDGIDWVTTYGRDARELRKLSDDAGLPVVAHTFFFKHNVETPIEDTARHSLDDACELGAPLVMIVPTPFPGVQEPSENRRRWCAILNMVAPMAEERNLVMTVENFPGQASPFVTAADFYEAKKQVPSLKLTFDNGNASSGEDQLESLKKCFNDIAHVHLKDWIVSDVEFPSSRKMRDGRYYQAALIGEGSVDSRATVRTLAELGYDGYINIEYENNKYPGDVAIKKALDYLR